MIPPKLVKAQLEQVVFDEKNVATEPKEARKVPVQFNPDSLKVSLSNQLSGNDQSGTSAIQFVGSGTSKLSFDLWFDVTTPEHNQRAVGGKKGEKGVVPDDVRKLTEEVAFFITPKPDKKDPKKFIPPGVRFIWGTFLFLGIMESFNEELSYFSEDGRPLRAKVSVSLTQRQIQFLFEPKKQDAKDEAKQDDTVADVAGRNGDPHNWPAVAAANGVETPRFMAPGTVLNTSAASAGAGFGASAGASVGFGGGASAGASFGGGGSAAAGFGGGGSAGASFGAGASASASLGGGLRAGAAGGAGVGIGGGAGAGIGGGGGAGIGGGVGGGFGGGVTGGFGGGVTGGFGGGGFSAGITPPTTGAGASFGGAAASASAKAHASFDLRLRR